MKVTASSALLSINREPTTLTFHRVITIVQYFCTWTRGFIQFYTVDYIHVTRYCQCQVAIRIELLERKAIRLTEVENDASARPPKVKVKVWTLAIAPLTRVRLATSNALYLGNGS